MGVFIDLLADGDVRVREIVDGTTNLPGDTALASVAHLLQEAPRVAGALLNSCQPDQNYSGWGAAGRFPWLSSTISERKMKHKATRQGELDRLHTLTTLEAVAYANQLSSQLKWTNCNDEERLYILELLRRLNERVHFLKINLEPPRCCRIGRNHKINRT